MIYMPRAKKGTVAIRSSNGRLQLVFRRNGKREFISTGLADEVRSRNLAEIKARTLENDLLTGNLDETYDRYRYNPDITPKPIKESPELLEIWSQYVEYKSPQVSITTRRKDYARVESQLHKLPYKQVDEAIDIRTYLSKNCTPETARRILVQLSAAVDWAIECKMLTDNPFDGLAKDIKKPKADRSTSSDIRPFTEQERQSISASLKIVAPEYLSLVEFLLKTGCRPGEAIALQWRHITPDFKRIHFEQTIVEGETGLEIKKGLKTQKRREFPASPGLIEVLRSLKDEAIKKNNGTDLMPDELVFRSLRGKFIDFHNFSNRIWRKVLINASVPERPPYHLRHTFITHCLDNGIDAKDVAAWVGNTPRVIYEYYAGQSKNMVAPDIDLAREPIKQQSD
jgi:integrase